MTVQHNDLHTDNVFAGPGAAPGSAPPGLRIFNWADAVISHPFICLGRAGRIGLENDEGEIDNTASVDPAVLRDAYLRCWLPTAQQEIPAEFRRSAEPAEALSNIALAASWLRLRPGLNPEFSGYFAEFVSGYADQAARLAAAGSSGILGTGN